MARKANLPLHLDKSKAWDGPGARTRMVNAARGEDGEINVSQASQGFVYMINDGSKQSDYKSPFADMIDGRKQVVWNGISAAKGRNGSVEGISDDERSEGLTFLEGQQNRYPSDDEESGLKLSHFRSSLTLQLDEPVREQGRILVASGNRTRNRDWWTGLPFRLIPDGMRLEYFLRNPLVLWMHDFNIPLAHSDLFLDEGMLWATDNLQFHRRTIPIVAQSAGGFFGGGGVAVGEFDTSVIADMWEDHFYNAVSVHVLFRPDDEENIQVLDEEVVAETSEVLEWSIVTFPADQDSGREDEQEEMVDRMVHKGMDREVAEAIAAGPGTFNVAGGALYLPSHAVRSTANSGSSILVPGKPEVPMSDPTFEVLEETAAAAVEEVEAAAQEAEVTEVTEVTEEVMGVDVNIPITAFVQELTEDAEAMHALAMALIQLPGFAQALMETLTETPAPATELVAEPMAPPITINFVRGNGQKAQPEAAPAPTLVRDVRPSIAQAAPVARPDDRKQTKKGLFGTMYRPV